VSGGGPKAYTGAWENSNPSTHCSGGVWADVMRDGRQVFEKGVTYSTGGMERKFFGGGGGGVG